MAWQDADGDHMSNAEEYIAGTDPQQSLSVFTMFGLEEGSATFTSSDGRLYDLEAQFVGEENWSVIVSNLPGTGTLIQIPTTNALWSGWYRAKVKQP
jgi:hypothetical protein